MSEAKRKNSSQIHDDISFNMSKDDNDNNKEKEDQQQYTNGIIIHSPSSETKFSSDFQGSRKQSKHSSTSFEDLLKHCGEAGAWQLKVFLLASYVGFCTAIHNLIYAFIGAIPDHWCEVPEIEGFNQSYIKDLIIPRDSDGDFEKCESFKILGYDNRSLELSNTPVTCNDREFDRNVFEDTIVSEWDLVCSQTFWASSVQACYMLGILIGSPILGATSDKIGRKKTILIATIIFVICGPLVAFSPVYWMVMLSRFILAAASPGIYGTSFVLVIEVLGPDWRGLAGTLFCIPFAIGYMVLPGVAYFVRDWRMLQLVFSVPSCLLLISWWFLPESPRWLLRKGHVARAETLMREIAEKNGKSDQLPSNFSKLVSEVGELEKEKVHKKNFNQKLRSLLIGYYKLIRTPKMRTRTLTIYFSWASISMIYYGLSLNSPNLAADRYLYMFISGVLEVPSYLMTPPLIKHIGRRPAFSGFLFICSGALLGSLAMDKDSIFVVILSLFGKLIIGSAYALIYLYATELMPTLLRTYGLGTASMVGRLGSVAAPFVVDLLGQVNQIFPTIVFGVISLLAGLISLLLPETLGKPLPETVADVEL